MFTTQEKNYIQDINELTDYIRTDSDWDELRSILIEKGFDIAELLLVSFMEDEEMNEYGVVVTYNKKVFEYERQVGGKIEQFTLKEITDDNCRKNDFPQIATALKMIDEENK